MHARSTASHFDEKVARKYSKIFSYPTKFLDKILVFLPRNSTILDAGCGTGSNARHLSRKGIRVQGIDTSKAMINIAKKRSPASQFSIMDMTMMGFFNNHFAGIIATFSLMFLSKSDIEKTLSECCRVLNSQGKIFLAIHTANREERLLVSDPLISSHKIRITLLEVNEFKTCLQRNGFCVLWEKHIPPKKKASFQFEKSFIIALKTGI